MAVIASLNTVFNADTSELDAAFKSMRHAQSEATRVIEQARGPLAEYMNTLDQLGAIYNTGGISLQDYNTALGQAREAYNRAVGPTAEMIQQQAELQRQAEETANTLEMAEQAARQWEAVMDEGARVTRDNLTPLESYEHEIAKLDKLLDSNAISFETWQRAATRAFDKLTTGAVPIKTLATRIRELGSEINRSIAANIAAAFGVREMGRFVAAGFQAVDALNDVAQATGATTQQLAALHVAAGLNASSTEAIDDALKKLNRTLGNADDSKKIQSSLDALGMSAEHLRSIGVGNAFAEISEAMKGIEDPAERAKIATDLFGKSGSELLNVLALGRDGLEQAALQAEALGLSIDGIDAANVAEANDAFDSMKMSFEGLAQQAAITFAPIVEWVSSAIPIGLKLMQLGFLEVTRIAVMGFEAIANGLSYLPDWLGGGVASDVSQFAGILREELEAKEKEVARQIDVLRGLETAGTSPFSGVEAPKAELTLPDNFGQMLDPSHLTEVVNGVEILPPADMFSNLMSQVNGFADFMKEANKKGQELIRERAASVIDSVATPLEKFEKTMADLEALKNVGAIDEQTFLRAQMEQLSQLDQANGTNAQEQRLVGVERGSAEAFRRERGKDTPEHKTQKQILDEAKRQSKLQEDQLKALKENGVVAASF